ncbi:MAG: hypothetical protein F9K29_24045 [Hyphomicrobiaceae bacterium]|nr:MAG: hypothetical protein F9K29_24045 [Hyphomicrobiaceae bacterium]
MADEKFEIIFYLSASGVECRVEYDAKENYDAARAILDARLHAAPVFRDGELVPHSVYYYVEDKRLEDFRQYLQAIPKEP